MYSWGGSTSDWKSPGGYKYDSARKPYLDKMAAAASARGGRAYLSRSAPDMKLVNPKGKTISSDSENPVVLGVDVTGSMNTWPKEIFDRLPLLYQTLSQYRPDTEISISAIGDANSDQYPLQVNSFGKGVTLEDHIKAICPEGGGGGQISESYELFGYFALNHCKTPKAKSPFLIIFGDEKFYPDVDKSQVAHYIGDKLQDRVTSESVWKGLLQRFNVFYLSKPYDTGDSHTTKEVRKYWADALGPERVIELPSMDRAVDVAIGIIAKYWGQYGDFTKSMAARHDSSTIDKVDHSIRILPADPGAPIVTASRLLRSGKGGVSKRLDS